MLKLKIPKYFWILLAVVFCLRLPSFFEPYWYGDEGIYLTLGQAFRKGLIFYKDIHDNKPPFLYLVAALAGNQFWFSFILFLWNFVNVWLLFLLAKVIFKSPRLAFLSSLVFAVLPVFFEGNIPNGEIFMIMPATWAMYLIAKKTNYSLAGLLFGIAFLFKVPSLFTFGAVFCFLLLFEKKDKLINISKNLLIFTLSFIFLPALVGVYYWFHQSFPAYLKACFSQNTSYLSSWGSESGGLAERGLVLLAALALLYLFCRRWKPYFLLITLWFLFDLFGALLSGRPYPHYLIQVLPAFSLLLVFLIFKSYWKEKIVIILSFLLMVFSLYHYRFWRYPVVPYYRNFAEFVLGKKSKQQYFAFFDKKVPDNYLTASWIKTLTEEKDYIYIWGDEPYLYALSQRSPASRYTVAYHVKDFAGWQETIKDIGLKQPKLIVMVDGTTDFPALSQIIKQKYVKITEIGKATIYQKL